MHYTPHIDGRREKQSNRVRQREHADYEFDELAREAKLLKDLKRGIITEKQFERQLKAATATQQLTKQAAENLGKGDTDDESEDDDFLQDVEDDEAESSHALAPSNTSAVSAPGSVLTSDTAKSTAQDCHVQDPATRTSDQAATLKKRKRKPGTRGTGVAG